ncbi:PREDICTED: 39S ribosomal protein L28, mitochondrial [Ceratosolen solmsi marchali]|uniref:Large ribosomal subunit protein bL28m n=1 Tax=Ceratosolen solmsi marchali TaxID=326594 RepID=A0AAJ6YMD4_9HYME|nr:PREDICTED: 39S ribosomal protein L28, mitochondrial [Ceratosolen solmsi marchali]
MSMPIEARKRLYYLPKVTRWTKGIGAALPEEYKKFWKEWKIQMPSPVYYIPKKGKYERMPDGTVKPIQNIPIPLKYPKELDNGIWGGEAVIQGFVKKHKYHQRFVRYWVPNLIKSVVYSEILNKYMRTIVTNRTLDLIHEHYGFDHYILKTPACDLRSLLALRLKRFMLISLADKTLYPDDPVKRDEVYAKYEQYLSSYTREEIEWYGLSYPEACKKFRNNALVNMKITPLKEIYRQELINELKEEKLKLSESSEESGPTKWISKINPFHKYSKDVPKS